MHRARGCTHTVLFTPLHPFPRRYTAAVGALATFTREFRALDTAWPMPALGALIKTLVATAQAADAAAASRQADGAGGGHNSRLNDAGSQLMKCFPATYLSPVREKKQATLLIVNAAFRVYFRLNTLRLCKNMIASVEKQQSNVLPFEQYDAGQRVCYRYYTGRLAICDEDYPKAEADLSYAFAACNAAAARGSAAAQRNVRRILRYLVPVKLLRGRLPKAQLLAAAGPELALYGDVAGALRRGDVRALNAALEAGLATLVRQGTYLLLEKLRSGVYRQLLKKVHLIQRDRDPGRAFQVHISLFQRALAMCGVDLDLDECECVLANLIYRKYVKGYISHKARTLVLSKQQPFPPLQSITFDEQT